MKSTVFSILSLSHDTSFRFLKSSPKYAAVLSLPILNTPIKNTQFSKQRAAYKKRNALFYLKLATVFKKAIPNEIAKQEHTIFYISYSHSEINIHFLKTVALLLYPKTNHFSRGF